MKMPDYLKCVIANRFTLAGYGLAATGITLMGTQSDVSTAREAGLYIIGISSMMGGMGLLAATVLGNETLRIYRLAKAQINRQGKIRIGTREKSEGVYCWAEGIRLAEREANLEKKVLKSISTTSLNSSESF